MKRLAYLVVCGAPPAGAISELVRLLQGDGWDVCVVPTSSAVAWLDIAVLEQLTGRPVRTEGRKPNDNERLPKAGLLIVAPATFNTINKWANGISDTFSLGMLNEWLGLGLPAVVSPYAKPSLASHPAFRRSLEVLRECGVTLTAVEALRPDDPTEPFRWHVVTDSVRAAYDQHAS